MRRLAGAALLAVVWITACSENQVDQQTGPQTPAVQPRPAFDQVTPGQTSDSLAIEGLILQLYQGQNGGDGPLNSAQTQFRQIAKLYTAPPPFNMAAVKSNTYSLINNILQRYNSGGLNSLPGYSGPAGTGTPAATSDLINLLLRYAGEGGSICTLGADCNLTVYQPGSPAQILVTPSGQAGISLPPGTGTVTAPTIISVSRIDDPAIRLHTQLDQYEYRYLYLSSSGEGADPARPFLQDVTVEVCLKTVPADPILSRLALAHDIAEPPPYENIQILPSAPAFLTTCGAVSAANPVSRYLATGAWQSFKSAVAEVFSPTPLYAAFAGTGTTGRLKNLSPFGAVDTLGFITPNSPTSATGPQGGTAPAPSVRLLTPTQVASYAATPNPAGAGMAGIPVTFSITAGGGCFANPCVAGSPTSLIVTSDASGYASVPAWTIGLGTNTVAASASIPCTATVAGGTAADCGAIVTAALASQLTFSATGLPPSQVGFSPTTLTLLTNLKTQVPAYAPGTPFDVTVLVQDAEVPPQTVPGSANIVVLGATNGALLLCPGATVPTTTCTTTAANGVATFTGVSVTTTGNFQLVASSAGLSSTLPAPDGGIQSVAPPGSARNIAINAGNNQTANDGATLGVTLGTTAPSVKVTDQYGNPVSGVGVSFAIASGAGGVGTGSATTNTSGIASTSWTIVAGTNTLNANITVLGPVPFVQFTATGNSSTTVLVSCPAAPGNGDELTRAFYINKLGKTLKQVTLYLASNDPANGPTPYSIQLLASAESFGAAPFATSTQTVFLRGNASQNLATQFVFPSSAIPNGTKNVAFQFRVLSNPHGARLYFAKTSGSCSSVTETAGVLPLPLSTALGKGIAITVLGN